MKEEEMGIVTGTKKGGYPMVANTIYLTPIIQI